MPIKTEKEIIKTNKPTRFRKFRTKLGEVVQTGVEKVKEHIKEKAPLGVITSGEIFKKGGLKKFAERLPSGKELLKQQVEQGPSFGVGGLLGKAKPVVKEAVEAVAPKIVPKVKEFVGEGVELLKRRNIRPEINTRNFKISDDSKKLVNAEIEELSSGIEKKMGERLTHQEVKEFADNTSQVLKRGVDREATKRWEAAVYNLRTTIADQAEKGAVNQEFIDNLIALKTAGADVARKLGSLAAEAGPANTYKQVMVEAVLDAGAKADDVIKAAEGIDFTNYQEATRFYRQFVKPTVDEWVDLIRYNSMLTSPNTHIVNVSSNILGSSVVRAVTKTVAGGLDFVSSKVTGKARKHFSGEGWTYIKSYVGAIGKGFDEAGQVMRGEKTFELPDIKRIPVAVTGVKGRVARALSFPLRGLEAADRFFTAIGEAGETATLKFKQKRGVKISEEAIKLKALKEAAYSVFRQQPGEVTQGPVLKAFDFLTGQIMRARNADNPIIRNISKWTLPFVQTPTNIVKQGVEYSPLGFLTAVGAKDVTTQLAKATIGSTVFGMTFLAYQSDKISGPLPVNSEDKAAWRAAGKLPWAMKVGDNWVQYNRLHPAISFPMALVSIIEETKKERRLDDDAVDSILKGISRYANFYSDQAYFKSIGDLFNAMKGDQFALTKLSGNYPQQVIPYRALGGWLARLFDEYQRKPDYKASFIDKQMQLLMMNIPGLSQNVPVFEYEGEPIRAEDRLLNALSPARINEANEQLEEFLLNEEAFKKAKRDAQFERDQLKEEIRPIYDEIQTLVSEDRLDEANELLENLTDSEYEIYDSINKSEKRRIKEDLKAQVFSTYQEIQDLLAEGDEESAGSLLDSLNEDEYRAYESISKSVLFAE